MLLEAGLSFFYGHIDYIVHIEIVIAPYSHTELDVRLRSSPLLASG